MARSWRSTPCPLCHLEIPAPDLAKAKAFYENVFGWKVVPEGETYWFFSLDRKLGGGFDLHAKPADQGVTLVLKVKDIPAKLDEIVKAGGSVVKPKTALPPGMGFYAYFRDPNGNRLAVWARR